MPAPQGALATRLGLLFLLLGPGAPLRAWGPLAHKVIARLAQRHLAPATLAALEELRTRGRPGPLRCGEREPAYRFIDRDLRRFFKAPRLDLGLVGSWADGWRSHHPATAPWHFVDLDVRAPLDAAALARACPDGACVSAQVDRWLAVLGQRSRLPEERLEALFFVVHLVADLHQPLHCATRGDHGGNQTEVDYFGRRFSLHEVWDSGLLSRGHQGAAVLLRQLDAGLGERQRYEWCGGNPEAWALESAALARDVAYGALPVGPAPLRLGRAYQARALPVARLQVQKAALRLACLLDGAFSVR